MSQDNKKSFVMYQGDGSNNVFSVPMTKGKYGTISVAFVRRGLDQYEYNPNTWGLNGGLFAWDLSGTKVYTDTATPAIGATVYDQYGVDTGNTVTAVGGATITVNTNVYTRDTLHDVDENTVLTWTGDTLQVGDYIVIERTTTRTQPFEFQNNQKHIEKSDDNLERQIQEVADKVDNALLVDPTHTIDSNKMNPVEWMKTILRSVDKSVRGFRYLNGWLDYSLDDPNIADVDKTWTHLVNTDNIKAIREQSRIENNETIYYTEYLAQDGSWKTLSDPHKWDNMKLSDLADTDFTNLSAGNFIMFDGLKWKNVYSSATASWGTILGNLLDQTDLKNALDTKADAADLSGKVNIDGTSIMTAPLKFMSGSVRGAVGPYFNGVGFWKLDSQGNLTQIASISDSQFIPTTTSAIDIGNSTKKWKDLYLSGKAYVGTINNGYDISVPAYAGTIVVADSTGATAGQILALDSNLKPVWQDAPTIPTVGDGTITLTQGGETKGTFTVNQSGDTIIDLDAGGGTSNYHPDLFDWKWADHQVNDVQWLRADTFSWQSGSVYQAAYKHLRNDMCNWYSWENNGTTIYTKKAYPEVGEKAYSNSALTTEVGEITAVTDTLDITVEKITVNGVVYDSVSGSNIAPTTETVGGVTVQYIPAEDGHKIVTDFHESEVADVYTATGVAWYYIIDTTNERFKLPRSKHSKYSATNPVVGTGMTLGLTNGTSTGSLTSSNSANVNPVIANNGYGVSIGTITGHDAWTDLAAIGVTSDATKSGIVAQQTEDTDQYKYLYFYVGNFTQTALENTAGLNAELFNGKADLNLANVLANIDFVVERQEPAAANNYTWYRKYRSGWVEQGGRATTNSGNPKQVTLPVEMADTNYNINILGQTGADGYSNAAWQVMSISSASTPKSTTGFYGQPSITGYNLFFYWEVRGMAAN